MTQSTPSRRRMLRVVGAVGLAGLAGCGALNSNAADPTGTDTEHTTSAAKGDETGDYERWLLAPSEVAFGDTILLTSARVNEIRGHRDGLPRIDDGFGFGSDTMVPVDTIERFHSFGSLIAMTGTFDAETATGGISDQFSETDTHRGYSVFAAGDVQAYGIADGTVLVSLSYEGADVRQNLREFIDTSEGAIPRLQDVNDAGQALVDALPTGSSVRIHTDADRIQVPDAVMAGSTVNLGQSESEVSTAVVFENAAAVDAERVRATVGHTAFFDSPDAVSVTTNGRAVLAQGTVPTEELQSLQVRLDGDIAGGQRQINATMDYRVGNDGGRLVITHNGGDPVPRDNLSIHGSGFANVPNVDATEQGQWAGTASGTVDGQPAVVFGDTMTVGVTPSYDISLWVSSSGGSETAERSSGPEA
ncbi:hypothetical protein [Halorhabdus sp. SVX81]|uniref:hypothetical protein n=1 Tax=Halorhabdus sp. SVX81 TaxID=2978283 RepID=UPI0023D9E725|nr:hypothetical protein [Halorhabdus sp. SVX81]